MAGKQLLEFIASDGVEDSADHDGLTGEGMTWDADGEPSKAPKAMKIVDGAYTAM